MEPVEGTQRPSSQVRPMIVGAVIGALVLGGAAIGVSAYAGAQDDPVLAAASRPSAAEDPNGDEGSSGADDPASTGGSDETGALVECVTDGVGRIFPGMPGLDEWFEGGELPDLGELDELLGDAMPDLGQLEIVVDDCAPLLPGAIEEQKAAWEEFERCLADQGVLDVKPGAAVHVQTKDGLQIVEFGDGEGSVTISGSDDGVTVTTEGDVRVLDEQDFDQFWDELDAAHDACAELVPGLGELFGEDLDHQEADDDTSDDED